jgi:hypothetical protein
VKSILRQLVPLLVLPLCLVASLFVAAPWLRSFPLSIAGFPLYGAAIISVLVPIVTVRFRPTWLWLGIVVDVVVFAVYALVVVLQDPINVSALVQGIYRGPSQLLTFALPLVSPRSLMVAPVALTWVAGALAGECVARRWYTMLPYAGFLVAFGLAYAGTQRAAGLDTGSARSRETLLAAGLLVTLLVLRVAQAWVRQDETAESTQPDGVLPLRGLVVGTVTTLVVALAASLVVQTDAFPKRANTPQRIPSVNDSNPLTPLAFTAGLRPRSTKSPGSAVFSVRLDKANPGYFAIANVDSYDGSGWSFDRTFRPSGGVLPADSDTSLRTARVVTQQYRIAAGPLTAGPWMPFLYRAQRVTGTSVNIDPTSGMIVPAGRLSGGESYTVRSGVTSTTFDRVKAATATADTTTPTIDTDLPAGLRTTLDRVVKAFTDETGVPSSPALPFLQALQNDLRTKYALSTAAQGSAISGSASPSPASSSSPTPTASSTPRSTPPATPKSTPKKSGTPKKSHGKRAAQVRPLGAKSPATHTRRAAAHKTKAASKTATKPATTSAAVSPTVTTSSPSPSNTGPAADLAGGTGFADVLASVLGNRTGTPEQYATLLALVARDLGVPARVSTGFRVAPAKGATSLAPGDYDVTTSDAWSWTEIPIIGVGWVVLDASPQRFTPDNQQSESAAPASPTSSAPPSQNALVTAGNGHAVASESPTSSNPPSSGDGLLVALLVVLAVLVIALLVILLLRKVVRAARRRRSADPRARLIGAWRESIDVLTEAGLPVLTALTSAEIATLTAEQFGDENGRTVANLGAVANSVAYSSATVVAPEQADAAWSEHRALRKGVRSTLGVRDRLAATMRYHRPGPTVGPTSPPSWADSAAAHTHGISPKRARRRYRGRRRAH